MKQKGFVLLTTVFLVLIMSSLLALVYVQVTQEWQLASDLEAQLRSTNLAENGVEYARHLLPHLDIDQLLVGGDGLRCADPGSAWRDPLPLDSALRWDPGDVWIPNCDDGLPPGGEFMSGSWEDGLFLVRFSNNPEEDPANDQDHIVLARSMGVVPHKVPHPFTEGVRNSVTTLETRLRQERLFELPSPLTLFGDGGSFDFQSHGFLVEGNDRPAVTVFGVTGTDLAGQLAASLSESQPGCFSGLGEDPSIVIGEDGPEIESLRQPGFWRHFEGRLSDFIDPFPSESDPGMGLYYLPEGGEINTGCRGFLVARGSLTLGGDGTFNGVLLHLGGGDLSIVDRAVVTGAVWLSNLDHSGSELESRELTLRIAGTSRIRYDRETINAALRTLPATQLGWRIIFPEMP